MPEIAEQTGSLQTALEQARRFLEREPDLAAAQAQEILKVFPQQADAQLLFAIARLRQGQARASLALLDTLAVQQPRSPSVMFARAQALQALGEGETAVAALEQAVTLDPAFGPAWLALGDHYAAMGQAARAEAAYSRHLQFASRDPRLLEAGLALTENRIAVAEHLLREHLKARPTDSAAIRMLAEVAVRIGRLVDAETLLTRCLELAPDFHAARHNYAVVLHRQGKVAEALAQTRRLLAIEPRNPGYRNMHAALLSRAGDYAAALAVYADVLNEYPHQPKVWMSYGHALKTVGREADSIEAYRKAISLSPQLGEAYWSLANLKTFAFAPAEIQAMHAQIARSDLAEEDRLHFHFALGKALEDAQDYAASFQHYAEANRLRKAQLGYDADETSAHVRRSKALFTREFFAARSGWGSPAPDPIFIVGLPRSGSTLIEQILASHPLVEGTMELPDLLGIARDLGGRVARRSQSRYPEALEQLSAEQCHELGERYLRQTRVQRKTTAPYFIDKMPNNFAHVGLLQLILPRARIIDARRHPLGCCFSAFKQHFARGQGFSYSLTDVGRYYHDYVELMAHFDAVLPGRVHRVIYEDLVEDFEPQVRALLDYCGLPFESACLRFHENARAVRTASAQQVRQPLYRAAIEHWRHYDDWLGQLKVALGPVLTAYPQSPPFSR